MESKIPAQWEKFYLKDVSFVNLMMRRIYNVLIVANPYDAFMLEDDGRIEEKIYNDKTGLAAQRQIAERNRRRRAGSRQKIYQYRLATFGNVK